MDSMARTMQSTTLSDQTGALNLLITEPAKLKEIMFAANSRDQIKRIRYLQTLLQKVHPKPEYWTSATTHAEIESKCFEVCRWFGLASSMDQLQGLTPRKDHEMFWCNVVTAAVYTSKELSLEEKFELKKQLITIITTPTIDRAEPEETEPTSPWGKLTLKVMESNEELLGMLNTFEQQEEQPNFQKFKEIAPKTEEALMNFLSLHYPSGKVRTSDTRPETGSKELLAALKSLNDELEQGVAAQQGVKSVFVEAALTSLNDSLV